MGDLQPLAPPDPLDPLVVDQPARLLQQPGDLATPVKLPPGRARLATIPSPTGSMTKAKTTGVTTPACFSARTAGEVSAMITSGFLAARSATSASSRLASPSAPSTSITAVLPFS